MINFADDSILFGLLLKHKLYWKFNRKKLKCNVCNNIITKQNLGTIWDDPDTKKLYLVCNGLFDAMPCVTLYTRKLQDKM